MWAVVKSSYMLEHPDKYNKYLLGNNLVVWDNQQERLVNTPKITKFAKWQISGFVDGEGSFCLNVKKHPNSKHGFRIDPAFYVYQHRKHRWFLEVIRHMFKGGSIHSKTSPATVLTYQLAGIRPNYEKVIPFFKKYHLITKQKQFELFTQGVELMMQKKHLTTSGKIELVEIAFEMNAIGKGRKWNKKEVISRILRD